MKVAIKGGDIEITEELRTYVRYRIHFALSRFLHRIRNVTVRLSNENGLRAEMDKGCTISVTMIPANRLVVAQTDGNVLWAIDRAVDQMGRAVKRHIQRIPV